MTRLGDPTIDRFTRIRNLSELKFATEAGGVYHVVKHGDELPPGELHGNLTNDFLASALLTVKHGEVTTQVSQDGKLKISFWRKVKYAAGSDKYMRAILSVSEAGDVSLATYMRLDKKQ